MAATNTNSRSAGAQTERMIVTYACANGFPYADRIIRTGAGLNGSHRADEGDIWLVPGIIAVQSKRDWADYPHRMERNVPQWMAETEAQRVAAKAEIALLIARRKGTAQVGEWWCFLPVLDFDELVGERAWSYGPHSELSHVTVRLQVADVLNMLRLNGYGSPLTEQVAA